MPLMPKRVKHRKMHRGSRSGNATSGTYVAFGDFGLQVLDRGWICLLYTSPSPRDA